MCLPWKWKGDLAECCLEETSHCVFVEKYQTQGIWTPFSTRKLMHRCLMDVMNLNQQSMMQVHSHSSFRDCCIGEATVVDDRISGDWQKFPAMMTSITAEGLQVSIGEACSCEENNKLILRSVHFALLFSGNSCLLVCTEMFLAEIYRDEKIWTQHPSQCRLNTNIDCTKSQVVYLSVPSGHV